AWYWLAPLALGLAAGVWLPVVIGSLALFPAALPRRWPAQAPPWRQLGTVVVWRKLRQRGGAKVAAFAALQHTEHTMRWRPRR
ncbi:MAG: hypothetical protein NTX16_09890, partial [Actinobacteria bacterium]|nr:hypothetical protein [Actinomycetota bacterium]